MITVDRPAIWSLANILQSNYFPKFDLIAPSWADSLDAKCCTVSSLSSSVEQRSTFLAHVHAICAVHNDYINCQSLPQLPNLITYYTVRTGCSVIDLRPSQAFVKSVYLYNMQDDDLFEKQRVFSFVIKNNKITFLKTYCEFRLLCRVRAATSRWPLC